MRTFEHFPEISKCPICGTNEDKECFLMPIDGTEDGSNCEAQPTHVGCVEVNKLRFNKEVGIIYYKI